MRGELTEQIESLIKPFIDELDVELVELNIGQRNKTVVVNIIADKSGGGITIDECTLINKKAVRAIEEEQILGEDFVVEVASPGLDRALKSAKDFQRAKGRNIRVHLLVQIEGKVEHHGIIAHVGEQDIQIQCKEQLITIPLGSISKAVQIID